MRKTDLLPCPFCGSDNVTIVKSKFIDGLFSAGCIKCNVSTAFYVNEKFAAETWNNRAPGWIPCIERMPEKDMSVLISAQGHRVTAYYDAVKEVFMLTETEGLFYSMSAVTHWMPLPQTPEVINNVD